MSQRNKRKLPKNAVKTIGMYTVEKIIDHGINWNGGLQYLIKWEGYDEEDNSWEFDYQLIDCSVALDVFKANSRHPPLYSFEEFNKFTQYLKRVVSPSFTDKGVLHRLSDKTISIIELRDKKNMSQLKGSIESKCSELFRKKFKEKKDNTKRREALKLVLDLANKLKIKENFGSIREFFEFMDRKA